MDGVLRRLTREQGERAALAWQIEALARTKKLPKLSEMVKPPRTKRKTRQPWEEQFSIAKAWSHRVSPAQ